MQIRGISYRINKKKIARFGLLLACIALGIFVYMGRGSGGRNVLDAFNPVTGKVIVIDAGHGGIDAGVIGPQTGAREDDLNLAVARLLRDLFEESGARVIMTRDKREGLYDNEGTYGQRKRQDMQRRKEIIENSNGDVLISIHMNKFSQSQYYGAQTFYQKGSEEGKRLAEIIQEEMVQVLDKNNKRQAKASDYFILRAGTMPSVIVECGFMSNPKEEKLLVQPAYQEKIAWSIYSGTMRFFSEE